MDFKAIMKYIGAQFDNEDMVPDEEGVCEIVAEQTKVSMIHFPEQKLILAIAPVAEVKPDMPAVLFEKLLASNFAFANHYGSTLSIDEKDKHIYLSRYDYLGNLDNEKYFSTILCMLTNVLKIQNAIKHFMAGDEHALDFHRHDDDKAHSHSDIDKHSVKAHSQADEDKHIIMG